MNKRTEMNTLVARMRIGLIVMLSATGIAALAAPADASTVAVSETELLIEGDNDSDVITISTDGTTLTITDTGTGGAVDNDANCSQVNPQTVTCPARLPGNPPIDDFEVRLRSGVDSFLNQNLVTQFGHIHSDDGVGNPAAGVKTIIGGPGGQLLEGGLESDNLDGGEGDDELEDGGGSDLAPTGGNDLLIGGPGIDEAFYSRDAAVSITLDEVANDGQAGEADNVSAENVFAGAGNDVLVGNGSSNVLVGAGGADLIQGLGGNDELLGEFDQGLAVARGFGGPPGDDTLEGGKGRDDLNCGRGFDIALRDPTDEVDFSCERAGAEVAGDSAAVSGKKNNKFKVEIACPESEVASCSGKLEITCSDIKVGKGKFAVAAGKSKLSKAQLTKKGARNLKKAGGSLLVTVSAKTEEPGGTSEDSGTVLIHR